MKTLAPLLLGFVAGWFGFSELYVVDEDYRAVFEVLSDFAIILAAMAYVLGGINVVQVNWPKIRRRESDWQFKIVLLVSAAFMFLVGAYPWHTLGGENEPGSVSISQNRDDIGSTALLKVHAADKFALVTIDGGQPMRAWHSGDPTDIGKAPGDQALEVDIEPGKHALAVIMPAAGYQEFKQEIEVVAGTTVSIDTDLGMYWGAKSPRLGRVYTWVYNYVFFPCNATMFALLAFFIASAAFRAFRARSTEAALLLGAAVLVMLGFVPIGDAIWSGFPEIAEWIMDVLNTTGRRAIIMGAALGAVATGLRVILGIERSHLGAGE